ncbi:MAG: CAP domain-containing protein [bacterium]|nr:CAP domain-containing protein [bacterium]
MLRVIFSFLLMTSLTTALVGCGSMGQNSSTLSYAPNDGILSYGSEGKGRRYTAEGEKKQRSARLSDKVPRGKFSKAPKNAFKNRDYSKTRLNPDTARKMINTYRASKGLKPLKINTKLVEAAKMHAKDLATHDRISHYGSDGSDPLVRVQRTGYPVHLAAENVGTGQVSLAEVFNGWQKSPGHNENLLLKNAKEMGIALIIDPDTEYKTFWTLVLGTKRS